MYLKCVKMYQLYYNELDVSPVSMLKVNSFSYLTNVTDYTYVHFNGTYSSNKNQYSFFFSRSFRLSSAKLDLQLTLKDIVTLL